jgi:tRNA-Thr(GGU) m(6)t(6)A37 methyltransferase TsaA
MSNREVFEFRAIGVMRTCFREKFGVPRQSMMMTEARGVVKLNPDPTYREAVRHLEEFSHLWILFVFDRAGTRAWRPFIEPPRVGAPSDVGVFASRSPHRPNPIGMSVVPIERIDLTPKDGVEIHVTGVDILDGTPVLDIKPYLPFADRVENASDGWVVGEIARYAVAFSAESLETLAALSETSYPRLRELITQMLESDPRPTSQRKTTPIGQTASEGAFFAFRVQDLDVRWRIQDGGVYVVSIKRQE